MYNLVVCGGTFDLLHLGHEKFLTSILDQSEKVILGLTTDKYTKESKEKVFEDYETRKKNLEKFLNSINALAQFKITPIDDVYGPLLDKNLKADALFVSEQTQDGATVINEKREKIGLQKIEVVTIDMDKAEDGELISSSRIRNGEIDRQGKLFVNPDWQGKSLVLPESLREELSKPFGKVLESMPLSFQPTKTITIGDVTTQIFNKNNVGQKLSIVDFTVKRERKFDKLEDLGFKDRIETRIIENPAGKITWDLFEVIKKNLTENQNSVILIQGEEDLAVLPAVLISPLGFKIYYGQPDIGLVEIDVTEEKKEEARALAAKFELSQTSSIG